MNSAPGLRNIFWGCKSGAMRPQTPWWWKPVQSGLLDGILAWTGIVLVLMGSIYCISLLPLSGLGCVMAGVLICWRFR